MTATYTDLVQTFVYTFFALAMNTIFITLAEVRARNVHNATAAPEDDRLKAKLGIAPANLSTPPPANQLTTPAKPEALARANNAHNNATENFVPYIMAVVPYIYAVGLQGSKRDDCLPVIILMCIYTFVRWVHSISYLGGWQPWRTLSFLTGMFTMGIISCYSVVAASKLSDL